MWLLKKFFLSEEEKYSQLRKKDAAVVFLEKALVNGDVPLFAETFEKLLDGFSDSARAKKKQMILRQLSKFAHQGVEKLVENGELFNAKSLVLTFAVGGVDLSETGDALRLKVEGTLKEWLSKNSHEQLLEVIRIQKAWKIPDSFFDEPTIYQLACKKAVRDIDEYFRRKNAEKELQALPLIGTALKRQYGQLPDIPDIIFHSLFFTKAVESRLKQYIKDRDLETAKKFAEIFHYEKLANLIENSAIDSDGTIESRESQMAHHT